MHHLSHADQLILAVANFWLYLRHPLFAGRFLLKQGRLGNFACPAHLSELVQWRKLFDRNPLFPILADKLAVRGWLAEHCPELTAPELLWVGDRPEDIPGELIAPGVVIKTNSGSTENLFPDREPMDRASLNSRLRGWIGTPLRTAWRRISKAKLEWAYWPIKTRLFVERQVPTPFVDIGVRCSNGTAFAVSVATDFKTPRSRLGYFYPDGERLREEDTGTHNGLLPDDFAAPAELPDAIRLARKISHGFDYMRVDFLAAAGRLYLSELTLYPASGYGSENWRTELAYRYWLTNLELSWVLRTQQSWPVALYLRAFRRWVAGRIEELGPPEAFLERQRAVRD